MASGELKAPDEHAAWLGHPAHADALPADSEDGPTHPTLALDGAVVVGVPLLVLGVVSLSFPLMLEIVSPDFGDVLVRLVEYCCVCVMRMYKSESNKDVHFYSHGI